MPVSPHRLAWAAILAVLVGLLSVPALVLAQTGSGSKTHPLVAVASQYEGTYQGECWVFVKNVVREALGIEMGFDYRAGYLGATDTETGLVDMGAKEIAVQFARPGDIIQIADDSYTEPDADYPGLHTFIISAVLEPGVFAGWDSNSNWDGMVRYRDVYDPRAVAARYPNLNFRIYRFPTPENPIVNPEEIYVAPTARQLAIGDSATVVADGILNLRAGAGLDQLKIGELRDGTVVTVVGGPIRAHGHTWVAISYTGGGGWVASEYLAYRGAASDTESAATTDGTTVPLYSFRTTIPLIAIGN
jgi:hypothetical protein